MVTNTTRTTSPKASNAPADYSTRYSKYMLYSLAYTCIRCLPFSEEQHRFAGSSQLKVFSFEHGIPIVTHTPPVISHVNGSARNMEVSSPMTTFAPWQPPMTSWHGNTVGTMTILGFQRAGEGWDYGIRATLCILRWEFTEEISSDHTPGNFYFSWVSFIIKN